MPTLREILTIFEAAVAARPAPGEAAANAGPLPLPDGRLVFASDFYDRIQLPLFLKTLREMADLVGLDGPAGPCSLVADLLVNFFENDGRLPGHMFNFIGLGPPGVGKTTFFRKMAVLFGSLGVLVPGPTEAAADDARATAPEPPSLRAEGRFAAHLVRGLAEVSRQQHLSLENLRTRLVRDLQAVEDARAVLLRERFLPYRRPRERRLFEGAPAKRPRLAEPLPPVAPSQLPVGPHPPWDETGEPWHEFCPRGGPCKFELLDSGLAKVSHSLVGACRELGVLASPSAVPLEEAPPAPGPIPGAVSGAETPQPPPTPATAEDAYFVEASRVDLVAQYVGQTAPKTQALWRRAAGKMLFIDEADTLLNGERDEFGHEALGVLNQLISTTAGNHMLAMATHAHEADRILDAIGGLRRRFIRVEFPTYGPGQLAAIFRLQVAGSPGWTLAADTDAEGFFARHHARFPHHGGDTERFLLVCKLQYARQWWATRVAGDAGSEAGEEPLRPRPRVLDLPLMESSLADFSAGTVARHDPGVALAMAALNSLYS